MQHYDVIIIGAGAAGLFCAFTAANRGRKVLVLDHANKAGKKILMSGGGYCNFTNLYTSPENFFSKNPHFCKSALSRYTPYDFLLLVEKHEIEWIEKEEGQLFCKHKSKDILQMLLKECDQSKVKIQLRTDILDIRKLEEFYVKTNKGDFSSESLVMATGGLSIPTLGATGFGYDIAKQFGLNMIKTRASLVPFTIQPKLLEKISELSGVSLSVSVSSGNQSLTGNLLFTHRGISGPVILQISNYWQPGGLIEIDLIPGVDVNQYLLDQKSAHPNKEIKNILSELIPKRVSQVYCEMWNINGQIKTINEKQLKAIAEKFNLWSIKPSGTEGYRTAEVTLGGVDTDELSSKTLESNKVPGLYFIGEVVDVTGQLGGFNFQWAWASANASGQVV